MSTIQLDTHVNGARHGHTRTGHGDHRWWALAVIGLAQLMVVLDATIVNIALPSAQHALHFTDDGRQWIVTAYSLAFGSLLLLGGRLADLFGRKATFIIGVVGFASASAVGGAATSFTMLVAARTTQGLFGALLAPAALSLLTTTFTAVKERARAFGIYGAIAGSGAAIGLILGGLLTEYLDWRWTLYVNDIIAVVALVGAVVFLRRSVPAQRPRLDVPGVVLVSGGLFCVVYGFANAGTHPWGDWTVWGFLAAGAVGLLTFFLWQGRARNPLLPLRVLADRDRGAALITVLVASAGMFGVFLFLTYYLQSTLGYSPVRNGVVFLPMVGTLMVTAQLTANLLLPRLGPKVIVPTGMLLAAGSLVWLTRLGPHSTYAAHVLPPLLALGLGLGLAMPSAMNRATLGVRMSDQGVASATVNTTQQIGGSISTALLNTLATTAATHYVLDHPTDPLLRVNAALHSYATAYWWSAGFFAAGAVITALLFRRKDTPATSTMPIVDRAVVPPSHATIHGRVLAGAGTPVPHAVTTLLDLTGHQLARAVTGEDGSYVVAGPGHHAAVLVCSAPGHQPEVATVSEAVVAGGGTQLDFTLRRTANLRGTVHDRDGRPVRDARVILLDGTGNAVATRVTADDGAYSFTQLPDREYTLIATGYPPVAAPVTLNGNGHNRFDVVLGDGPA